MFSQKKGVFRSTNNKTALKPFIVPEDAVERVVRDVLAVPVVDEVPADVVEVLQHDRLVHSRLDDQEAGTAVRNQSFWADSVSQMCRTITTKENFL